MEKKFTVNELVEELGISHTAIRKRIKRGDLRNVEERINGRLTTHLILTDQELFNLKKEIGNIKQVSSTFNEFNEPEQTFSNQHTIPLTQQDLIYKVLEHSEKFNERLESYFNRLVNSEAQIKLLEDSESRTKREYNELNAEIKHLRNINEDLIKENQQLKQQLEQERSKPFWKKKVL